MVASAGDDGGVDPLPAPPDAPQLQCSSGSEGAGPAIGALAQPESDMQAFCRRGLPGCSSGHGTAAAQQQRAPDPTACPAPPLSQDQAAASTPAPERLGYPAAGHQHTGAAGLHGIATPAASEQGAHPMDTDDAANDSTLPAAVRRMPSWARASKLLCMDAQQQPRSSLNVGAGTTAAVGGSRLRSRIVTLGAGTSNGMASTSENLGSSLNQSSFSKVNAGASSSGSGSNPGGLDRALAPPLNCWDDGMTDLLARLQPQPWDAPAAAGVPAAAPAAIHTRGCHGPSHPGQTLPPAPPAAGDSFSPAGAPLGDNGQPLPYDAMLRQFTRPAVRGPCNSDTNPILDSDMDQEHPVVTNLPAGPSMPGQPIGNPPRPVGECSPDELAARPRSQFVRGA